MKIEIARKYLSLLCCAIFLFLGSLSIALSKEITRYPYTELKITNQLDQDISFINLPLVFSTQQKLSGMEFGLRKDSCDSLSGEVNSNYSTCMIVSAIKLSNSDIDTKCKEARQKETIVKNTPKTVTETMTAFSITQSQQKKLYVYFPRYTLGQGQDDSYQFPYNYMSLRSFYGGTAPARYSDNYYTYYYLVPKNITIPIKIGNSNSNLVLSIKDDDAIVLNRIHNKHGYVYPNNLTSSAFGYPSYSFHTHCDNTGPTKDEETTDISNPLLYRISSPLITKTTQDQSIAAIFYKASSVKTEENLEVTLDNKEFYKDLPQLTFFNALQQSITPEKPEDAIEWIQLSNITASKEGELFNQPLALQQSKTVFLQPNKVAKSSIHTITFNNGISININYAKNQCTGAGVMCRFSYPQSPIKISTNHSLFSNDEKTIMLDHSYVALQKSNRQKDLQIVTGEYSMQSHQYVKSTFPRVLWSYFHSLSKATQAEIAKAEAVDYQWDGQSLSIVYGDNPVSPELKVCQNDIQNDSSILCSGATSFYYYQLTDLTYDQKKQHCTTQCQAFPAQQLGLTAARINQRNSSSDKIPCQIPPGSGSGPPANLYKPAVCTWQPGKMPTTIYAKFK